MIGVWDRSARDGLPVGYGLDKGKEGRVRKSVLTGKESR
jgi:hypothetical protein